MSNRKKQKIYKPFNQKTSIFINNKKLSMQLGDNLLFNAYDKKVKTIVDICINIDGGVKYHLKWFDGTSIRDEWLNENEISAMSIVVEEEEEQEKKDNSKIGF